MQIAETIPFLAFREYIEKDCRDRNELEKKLLQDLCSVHYNALSAGFLFEPYLTITLEKLFNGKICAEHSLFNDIKNIDKLELLSYKATIRNLHDSTILCSRGNMKKFNLHDFLDYPSTAFFMPEKEATADNLKANELLIIIDHSNSEHFFSNLELNVLNAAKRVNKRVNNKEIDIDRQRKKIKTAD
ncbi:uncharacterized protein OCT59_008286 [Rhizophagus irregularis]|uniref:Uncharacterized protein n=2 Tax=Rhizophagus irregularis TaxID=588596 RepID=A0A015L9R0_RHIIW|nr:hypothetical protein GLOIN_2v1670961 [Rhizophagus irregularis DAOM 181602=DAOM 197198]EXX51538.1 hypothetical protein RirG_260990 [Rhizophagus irregularis DAOM 197198w]POG64898.1 hypothetical protein GLOIN_2v1670961 [Rhizophagus irregularis DAOM 181602=DAOM 197198]UZO16920.1 hypothetical protein OCT59_008286 [Rhizophagus irregularis]|eukprot:XP_025171764.1 hypothetical protein GLOIN_2v1670961 [Rhizophagus irregularis DAOM 181602=DAOM 197198]